MITAFETFLSSQQRHATKGNKFAEKYLHRLIDDEKEMTCGT